MHRFDPFHYVHAWEKPSATYWSREESLGLTGRSRRFIFYFYLKNNQKVLSFPSPRLESGCF